jgi:hypothetical protein
MIANGSALRIALPLAAAFLAALSAHVAIDVAGDYVLAHDTYDDPAHGSRWLASIALGISACIAVWALGRAALAESRGSHEALRRALRAAVPSSFVSFSALVTAASLPMLAGMAWLDAVCAGIPVDDVGDLFGGCIPLGSGITVALAIVVATAVHRLVALLCRFHRSIVRAVEAFVRLPRSAARAASCLTLSVMEDRPRVPASLARCTGADRAPPCRTTLIPS